jgi:hypothetical protein
MSDPKWQIEGDYFESCNCDLLCPCLLSNAQARPTQGHCDVVLATRIAKGSYGEVDLSGLNAVQALTTPAEMSKGGGTLAVYIDSRADDDQRTALDAIFSGKAGGPPSLMNGMVATRLPITPAQINFSGDGKRFSVSIPGVTDVTVEGVMGAGNQVVWIENVGHPFSRRLAAAKATQSHFTDHSLHFENSGRNGHFSSISWSNG